MLQIILERWKKISSRSPKSNFVPPPKDSRHLPTYNIPINGLFMDNIPDKDYVLAKIIAKQNQLADKNLICYN
ncbi:MAG: hypothetical protein WCK37_03190 [Candidatus Falkowbacteria bacterium]